MVQDVISEAQHQLGDFVVQVPPDGRDLQPDVIGAIEVQAKLQPGESCRLGVSDALLKEANLASGAEDRGEAASHEVATVPTGDVHNFVIAFKRRDLLLVGAPDRELEAGLEDVVPPGDSDVVQALGGVHEGALRVLRDVVQHLLEDRFHGAVGQVLVWGQERAEEVEAEVELRDLNLLEVQVRLVLLELLPHELLDHEDLLDEAALELPRDVAEGHPHLDFT